MSEEPRVAPQIGKILDLLKPGGKLDKAAKKQSEGLTETGAIYKEIEKDLNGNRGAVSFIRRLDKMSDEKREDFIRTMEPLLVKRGYTMDDIEPDLADQGEADDDNDAQDDADGQPNAPVEPEREADGADVPFSQTLKDAALKPSPTRKLGIVAGGKPH